MSNGNEECCKPVCYAACGFGFFASQLEAHMTLSESAFLLLAVAFGIHIFPVLRMNSLNWTKEGMGF